MGLRKGELAAIRSDGSPERDFLHVDDAVSAYLAIAGALHSGGTQGEAFNGAATVQGDALLKAGNDMVLIPLDIDGAYNGLLQSVRSGEIPESQIDQSVLKVLRASARTRA